MQWIPACIIAYSVLKYGSVRVKGEAESIGNRISVLVLIGVPVIMLGYYLTLPKEILLVLRLKHIVLAASPMFIAFYSFIFVLTRPISQKIDDNFEALVIEKEKSEKAKRNIEKLNELSKAINTKSNLDEILSDIFAYLQSEFSTQMIWLMLVDSNKNELYTHKFLKANTFHKQVDFKELSKIKIPLKPETGSLYRTYKMNKILHIDMSRVNEKIKSRMTQMDIMIFEILDFVSFIHIPLSIQNKVIGILAISIGKSLGKKAVQTLAMFGEQIAGAIHNAELLKKTKEAKTEIEKLNEFSKKINSNINLNSIVNDIFKYLEENFQVNNFFLWTVEETEGVLKYLNHNGFVHVTEAVIELIKRHTIPLNENGGIIYKTYLRKKPFYLRKMIENIVSPSDKFILENSKVKSVLLVPITNDQRTVAVAAFGNTDERILTNDEISRISIFCDQIASAINNSLLLEQIKKEQDKSETLLHNILPPKVARELKEKGEVKPTTFPKATVMFTDFKGFTKVAETMTVDDLIKELDNCFYQFDEIIQRNKLEKIKTIGDSYMCAGGLPEENFTHVLDSCLAALEIQGLMRQVKEIKETLGFPYWELRLGIHVGSVIAGVVGKNKFAYDIWGDTVNTASRMESSGAVGMINISGEIYKQIKFFFECEYRGKVKAKNKGEIDMYFLHCLKKKYARDEEGRVPNERFKEIYTKIKNGARIETKIQLTKSLE